MLIPPPPPHIAAEIAARDAIVAPVLAARGLRLTIGNEYPAGRTVRLSIAGNTHTVRAIENEKKKTS